MYEYVSEIPSQCLIINTETRFANVDSLRYKDLLFRLLIL